MVGLTHRGPSGPSPSNSNRKNYKILLRKINPSTPTTHEQIFRVTCREIDTPLTRIQDTHNGFNAYTDKQENIDKLLTPSSIQSLRNISLEPTIPPELRAKRSVFVRQVDHSVGSRATEEIKRDQSRARAEPPLASGQGGHKDQTIYPHFQTPTPRYHHGQQNHFRRSHDIQYPHLPPPMLPRKIYPCPNMLQMLQTK